MNNELQNQTLAFPEPFSLVPAGTDQQPEALVRLPVIALRDPPPWLKITLSKLEALGTLQENWDSYGAAPVERNSIREAQKLLMHLAMYVGVDEPAVGATPDGEAGLSWDGGPWSLDVDVTREGRYEYVFLDDRDSALSIEASTRDKDDLLIRLTTW